MPAVQRSEFALALNQVASERGVDVAVVLDTVKNAILAAYRKDHPGAELEEYTAELNSNTGEAHIIHNGEDVTPPGFGRIAAQTAKQVILQKIREKEKEAILSDFRVKIGSIVNGMILRFAGPNVIVDIGKTEAIMPPQEQISQESYHLNQRLTVALIDIREGTRGEEVIVSRGSNSLIEGLFKREVPEVASGSVQIKEIVREPGNRTKVAVYSSQPGIDPVGSCVGQKGVRVQAIIQEFNGIEKIDIIQWAEDQKTYIAQALSPAKNVQVKLDEDEKVAHVTVPAEELSLAIGKDGQNVRLASKLTGYRIEIEGQEGAKEPVEETKAEATEKAPETPREEVKTEAEEVPAEDGTESVSEPVAVTETQVVTADDTVASADSEIQTAQSAVDTATDEVLAPDEQKAETEDAPADVTSEEQVVEENTTS